MRRTQVKTLPEVGKEIALPKTVAHYLLHVLRLRHGDTVELFNGRGGLCRAELVLHDAGEPRCRGLTKVMQQCPTHALHLVIGILKGPAMDLAVRQATETGATHIHAVPLSRSVSRSVKLDRWLRIATEAARQCGRADIPQVASSPFGDVLGQLESVPHRFIASPGAARPDPVHADAAVIIGPEGGLTEPEILLATERGFQMIGLGRWILRASTAVPVALALTSST
jgi:16S rRNA (uracil1498-N3)-methyltransferase